MGNRVNEPLRRLSDLRAHIEGYAARHAALRAAGDPAGVKRLDETLARLTAALRAHDYPAFQQADFALHAAMIRMAGVPQLYECWLPAWQGLRALHSSSFAECWPDLRVLAREHGHLVQDIRRGDAAAAEETARSHIGAVWYRYDREWRDPTADDPLQRAAAAIAFNLASPLTLREVAARIAFVSPGHLSQLFRKRHGVSFQKYVQTLRLEKAARLLSNTGLPIGEIARRVGYRDVSRFGQHFRRRYGTTPRAWRKGA